MLVSVVTILRGSDERGRVGVKGEDKLNSLPDIQIVFDSAVSRDSGAQVETGTIFLSRETLSHPSEWMEVLLKASSDEAFIKGVQKRIEKEKEEKALEKRLKEKEMTMQKECCRLFGISSIQQIQIDVYFTLYATDINGEKIKSRKTSTSNAGNEAEKTKEEEEEKRQTNDDSSNDRRDEGEDDEDDMNLYQEEKATKIFRSFLEKMSSIPPHELRSPSRNLKFLKKSTIFVGSRIVSPIDPNVTEFRLDNEGNIYVHPDIEPKRFILLLDRFKAQILDIQRESFELSNMQNFLVTRLSLDGIGPETTFSFSPGLSLFSLIPFLLCYSL